jgi:phospholipid/cholesterol/gamma-HCH transport system substrate-binding protein
METRAPFVIVGAFVLAAIAAVFGFVYWLNNAGGIGKRESYAIVFNGPVPGLLVGAAVLFNGIRVGEVTSLGLVADSPRDVRATIAVAAGTPVRSDTKVGLDFQGLTGVPVVALEGGESASAPKVEGALIAEKGAGLSMTQAARDALRKVDSVLSENSGPLHDAINNLSTFTGGLARNTPKLDGIVAGLERMTGATTPPRKVIYDLKAADSFATPHPPLEPGLIVAEPTATTRLQTQRFLFASDEEARDEFANAQWSDSLPALVQAKLLQSFENYDIAHAPLRGDFLTEGGVRLLIDLRQFEITDGADPKASIALSVKLIDGTGHLKAARIFQTTAPMQGVTVANAVAAFGHAFEGLARDVVTWTVSAR